MDGKGESRRPNDKMLRPQLPRPRTSGHSGRVARPAVAAQGYTAVVSAAARAPRTTSPPRDGRTAGADAVAVSAATRPRTSAAVRTNRTAVVAGAVVAVAVGAGVDVCHVVTLMTAASWPYDNRRNCTVVVRRGRRHYRTRFSAAQTVAVPNNHPRCPVASATCSFHPRNKRQHWRRVNGERARWRGSPTRGWRISAGAVLKRAAWYLEHRPSTVGRAATCPGGDGGAAAAVGDVVGDGGEVVRRGDGDAGAAADVGHRSAVAVAAVVVAAGVAAADEDGGDVPGGAPRSIGSYSSVAVA